MYGKHRRELYYKHFCKPEEVEKCTTCCKLSTGVNNVALPTGKQLSTRLFSHDNNVVTALFNHQYCYNLLTRLNNNNNNDEQDCSINTVFSCFNNRCCFINVEQDCWNNSERHCNNMLLQHCSTNLRAIFTCVDYGIACIGFWKICARERLWRRPACPTYFPSGTSQ